MVPGLPIPAHKKLFYSYVYDVSHWDPSSQIVTSHPILACKVMFYCCGYDSISPEPHCSHRNIASDISVQRCLSLLYIQRISPVYSYPNGNMASDTSSKQSVLEQGDRQHLDGQPMSILRTSLLVLPYVLRMLCEICGISRRRSATFFKRCFWVLALSKVS